MRGQVLCRCRARVRAVDLSGPGETVSALKRRVLALNDVREPAAERWTRIVHKGRWLADESRTLAEAGVGPGSAVELAVSRAMCGGGGDGGATGAESRSCYLEMYADGGGQGFSRKQESLGGFVRYSTQSTVRDRDEKEEDLARWFNCALTEEPLETREGAVVIDRLGSLFNKEPVIKALRDVAVDGAPTPKRLEHVAGLKSLTTLKLHRVGNDSEARTNGKTTNTSTNVIDASSFRLAVEAKFSCPVTGLDLNGKTRFFALAPSGLVVSDRALREAKAAVDDMLGPECALADQTRIPLCPKGDELEAMREALAEEAARKAAKKAKKARRRGDDAPPPGADEARASDAKRPRRERNGCDDLSVERLKNQAKTFKAGDHAPAGADKDVYASLFTSSSADARGKETFLSRNARKAW